MDGSGVWSVELHECRGRRDVAGRARRIHPAEAGARAALAAIYQLSRHLEPLPTWEPQQLEPGRWWVRVYEPTSGVLPAHTSAR